MADFIDLVLNPEIVFMRYALVAGVLSSIAMGIIGLFIGAVVLALGYELLVAWMAPDEPEAEPAEA